MLASSILRRLWISLLLASWILSSTGCMTYAVVKDEWNEPTTSTGYSIAAAAEIAMGISAGLSQSAETNDGFKLDGTTLGAMALGSVGIDALFAVFFMLVFKSDDPD